MESSRVLDASAAPCCDGSEQLGDSFGESEKLGDELLEDLESSKVLDASNAPCCDGSEQLGDSFGESEKLGDELLEDLESSKVLDASAAPCCDGSELLEDLDSYLDDINDRLTISRMVSDSVIRGMVTAVKQEADEKIAQKELEVAALKDMLYLYHTGVHENRSLGSPLTCHESKDPSHFGTYYNFPDAFSANDRMGGSLVSLRDTAKDQFKTLKKEIDLIRGFSHIRSTGTGPEQLGPDGILQDKMLERWTAVDITIENLNTTIDSVYKWVEDMFQLSRSSFCVWRQEQEFQAEIEAIVVKNCIRSLQEEFEEKVWDQITQFCGNGSVNWLGRIKEISSLRQDLDNILKSVPVYEIGQLTSLGSLEIGEEWSNDKRADHFHRKALSNHVSSSTMMWEGNGKHEDSNTNVPENSDPAQLKHMSTDELITEMTKVRRNHEAKVQEMTEKNFYLKRELLKLRKWGSPLAAKKDKEVEMLKKKIPDFISRLDDILAEHQKLHAFSEKDENLGSLRDRLESLLSENRQLRDLLSDKKKEVKWLSSQVSDAEDKMSQHHLLEANLQFVIEDAHIENLISGDVYKCVLEELMCQIRWSTQESDLQYNIMRESYAMMLEEAARVAEPPSNYEIEDSDMESIIMQEVCGITCREALKDAEENVNNLYRKYANEYKRRVSLEVGALEKEEALRLELVDKERFKQDICSLTALVEEKEKLVQETAVALAEEKKRFELASQERDNLRVLTHQQKILLLERSDESNIIKGNLDEALEQIAQYNVNIRELNLKLELAMKDLRGVDKEKRMLRDLNKETEKALSLLKVGEREHQKQMESTIILVEGLLKEVAGFECGVTKKISNISLRLEKLISESHLLIPKVNVLQRTGLKFKQRLARRCSDLEKAEAEVDLLGDEVDALLILLEKIYIALDHYSPILQHYPGITEILKLVKRELSGEPTRPA